MYKKFFLDLNFYEAVIDKISYFHEIAANFTNSEKKNRKFFKYHRKRYTNCFYPQKFYGRDMLQESTFSFLPVNFLE